LTWKEEEFALLRTPPVLKGSEKKKKTRWGEGKGWPVSKSLIAILQEKRRPISGEISGSLSSLKNLKEPARNYKREKDISISLP